MSKSYRVRVYYGGETWRVTLYCGSAHDARTAHVVTEFNSHKAALKCANAWLDRLGVEWDLQDLTPPRFKEAR